MTFAEGTLTEEGLIAVPGLLSRWVRLSTGVKVHYSTAGETGPAVVLLHGGINGSSGAAGFRYLAPFLGANGFRVYAPDMPSFGLTEDPTNFYGYGQGGHVDFIHDFVNAVCLDKFFLGGNSMGCSNTVAYTTAHPERVTAFALIAGNIGDLMPRSEMRKADPRPDSEIPNLRGFDGTPEHMRKMLEAVTLDPTKIGDDVVQMRTLAANKHADIYDANMAKFQAPQAGRSDVNELARLRTKGRFDQLTIPGIYLFGKQDVLIHVNGGYLQEDVLPNVQFFYPEDTGHQGQTDQPDLFNQVFLEFFRDGKVSYETAVRAGVSDRRPINPERVALP